MPGCQIWSFNLLLMPAMFLQAQSAAERMGGEASVSDDWELDPAEIQFLEKIASGAFGDLYKGLYCGQEVAIKILRDVQDDPQQYQEFLQVNIIILREADQKATVKFPSLSSSHLQALDRRIL